jgi:hypothetical protein
MDGSSFRATATAPEHLSLEDLEARITELAGHLNAANYRWLALIAEFDRREGWTDGAFHSCAHWLNFKCSLDLGAAREKVRVARALESLPKISESMSLGQLSYSKVRALTRVADAATEEDLLNIALHGTAHHVETLVRHLRRVQEAVALSLEERQHANRSLHYWFDADGSIVIKARLPAVAGAAFIKALEAAGDQLFDLNKSLDVSAGRPTAETPRKVPDYAARRADAAALIAETFLQERSRAGNTADRYQVVVHVDQATLQDNAPGRSEIEGASSIAAETARRIACDSSLIRIVENEDGEPLDIGRKTRSIPPALRRALKSRDKDGCRFPGCTHRRFLDAHHIHHWARGGETKLGNLLMLCRYHHRLVHEGGIRIQRLSDGALRFVRPDGRYYHDHCCDELPAFNGEELIRAHADCGIRIAPDTAVTRWCGERMDYGLAVAGLIHQSRMPADAFGVSNVSAETSRDNQAFN